MKNTPSQRLDYILEANLICSNILRTQRFTHTQIEEIVKILKKFLPNYVIPSDFNLIEFDKIKNHLDYILEE